MLSFTHSTCFGHSLDTRSNSNILNPCYSCPCNPGPSSASDVCVTLPMCMWECGLALFFKTFIILQDLHLDDMLTKMNVTNIFFLLILLLTEPIFHWLDILIKYSL